MLPKTTHRVTRHTKPEINERIRERIETEIQRYSGLSEKEIQKRIGELEHEWDMERTLETNAALLSLLGLALSRLNRQWLFLPTVVSGFLLQHALQGWCPPIPIFRRLGVRTEHEIEKERYGLKAARGDFNKVSRERNGSRKSLKIMEALEA